MAALLCRLDFRPQPRGASETGIGQMEQERAKLDPICRWLVRPVDQANGSRAPLTMRRREWPLGGGA